MPKQLFKKGQKKTPGSGRAKGTPNRVTRAVKEFLIDLTSDVAVQESLRSQILCGEKDAVRGFFLATEHVIGKAKATIELDASPSMSRLLSLAAKENAKEDREKRAGEKGTQKDRG